MSALLEKILSRDNMFAALDKVKANKGAGGIDGISVNEIDQYLKENWVDIRDEYSCAVTPQIRQTGNRLSGNAGTAYASLLA